jgi:copper oxidase (laccase) domain-containing protein
MLFETFAPLDQLGLVLHAFTLRTTEDTKAEDFQQRFVHSLGFALFAAAEQTHGNGVAVVDASSRAVPASLFPQVDALVTRERNLPLVIRCADCADVYIIDRKTPAIGLVHSGKMGTLGKIVPCTILQMQTQFGTNPSDCLAFISPSIGPCHYEVDIWDGIEQQLCDAGVKDIYNPRVCTACHLDRYFSYRAEKGRTGRMLAVLALKSQ